MNLGVAGYTGIPGRIKSEWVIRKTTKTRGSFPTDAAATKLIYLAIRNFEKAGRCVREWVAARNQFAILYPERFNK